MRAEEFIGCSEKYNIAERFILAMEKRSLTPTPIVPTTEPSHSADELEKNRYRYGGIRYGFRGPSRQQSNQMIPDEPSLITAPRSGA